MKRLIMTSIASSSEDGSNSSGGTIKSLMKLFTNPYFYIIVGCLLAFVIVVYLVRRFVKAKPNATTIILRRGKVHKLLNNNNPKCFLVPFFDSVGAIITDGEKEFSSDKLFINNGPDALYKINYTLRYKVTNPKNFYELLSDIPTILPAKLNDELRLFADQGNALLLIRDYRENADKILEAINKAISDYSIEATVFKINSIEPMGR